MSQRQPTTIRRGVWRLAALPGNIRGALWVLVAGTAFTGMTACIKALGPDQSVWQLLMLRSLFALLIILPFIARAGAGALRTRHPKVHIARSVIGIAGITCVFLSVTHLDLTLAITLGFTRSLFVILLALMFLGEVIRLRRTAATLVGFVGVLICLQPGGDAFDPWALVALLAAVFAAGVSTLVKRLTMTEPPITILAWTYGLMTLFTAVPAILTWQSLDARAWALLIAMSVFTTIGQGCMVFGLRAGEATAVMPFDYARLLYATAVGYLLFAELPALATLLGAAVITASTLYIAYREARLGRRQPREPTEPS